MTSPDPVPVSPEPNRRLLCGCIGTCDHGDICDCLGCQIERPIIPDRAAPQRPSRRSSLKGGPLRDR